MEPEQLRGRDFLGIEGWTADELVCVLDLADRLKAERRDRIPHPLLPGRTLGMVFEKPSTRTRVSFEVGMYELGGVGLHLGIGELQLSRGEPVRDAALVLSRYLDGIMIRTFRQSDVEELAAYADVPVVNGLTDEFHPCQALADAMTIRERFGSLRGVRIAYVGDGNNVCHSLVAACALLGASVVVATPPGFEPAAAVVATARADGGDVTLVNDPEVAAEGSDVVYTDVWTSMGQEEERNARLRAFRGFIVDERLLGLASDRAVVMHCLPAHVGEEISEGVLYGPRSVVWDQAENRLHAQKALLASIVA